MEVDKENIKTLKITSKIPLPVEPLPALPKHLVEPKKKTIKETNERYPLKTLNLHENLALPGPSQKANNVESKSKNQMIDLRYVTKRPKVEDLDWDYKVFKDDGKEDVIIISDDDDERESSGYRFFVDNRQRNCLGEPLAAVTPALKDASIENNRVKNVKRSLKRPHSRELQGLSPLDKDQRKGEEKVRRKLHFSSTLQDRLMPPDCLKRAYMKCFTKDYAEDTFSYLVSVEQPPGRPQISSVMRACLINWLMKVHGADGNPATIQTAAWYLDSVLSHGLVTVENLQLIAAACYWIAHKLHGPGLPASRIIQYSNNAFTADRLLIAEKSVLERLKFPPQPVVPQEFITYFSWWCDNSQPGEIEVAATFICMTGLLVDKSLCQESASVIGAAAVRNALILLRKRDLMVHLQLCPVFRSAEKKATKLSYICSIQRKAVRTVASPNFEYKAPFDQYGTPPNYIAQRVINAANELNMLGH